MITISNPPSKIHQTDTINQDSKKHQALKSSSILEKTRKQLRALSNTKLLSNIDDLNHKERRIKILVLLYLAELDSRQLYLPMGFSSLFDFCIGHLKYTRATAARRIRAARAAEKYPQALDMLRSGEINITILSMISDILDEDNHTELLDAIKNKSTRRVEMLVSRHRPVPVIRDTVRPVCVMRRIETPAEEKGSGYGAETDPVDLNVSSTPVAGSDTGIGGQNLSPTEDTGSRKSNKISSSAETKPGGSDATPCAETYPASKGRVILEQHLKLGFSVSPEFMKKYNKIKSLLSNKHPGGISFEMLFEHLMDEYLERHDPESKRARRIQRVAARENVATRDREPEERRPRKAKTSKRSDAARGDRYGRNRAPDRRSRRIPTAVRDKVFARDTGRCTFVGANGKRCNATWDLEIDHIVPVAKGGGNSPENLRLLCRKHNIYQAEKIFGGEFMKNHIKK